MMLLAAAPRKGIATLNRTHWWKPHLDAQWTVANRLAGPDYRRPGARGPVIRRVYSSCPGIRTGMTSLA